MKFRILRPLDRYVLSSFFRIFTVTALGFPLLVIVIDATDNLRRYLARAIPPSQLALSYLYYIPESLFMVLPASVLFATVFTIGTMTRHSEVTAAKASGVSFYRLIAPMAFGAAFASGLGLVVGELVPIGTERRNEILGQRDAGRNNSRYHFVYAADEGRVYSVAHLDATATGRISRLEITRRGTGPEFPTLVAIANEAEWIGNRWWQLREGTMHVIPSDTNIVSFHFVAMRDLRMKESPRDLLQKSTQPDEMRRAELGSYVRAMERSGQDVNPTRVDRMLRIAIPATCLIIFLFAAPLATGNQRGGAAFGVGIALATTVVFLMLVQLTKAVGGTGLMSPELAAWIPSMVFGAAGIVLLARVRT